MTRMLVAALAGLAACAGSDDPCESSKGTCITLHVSSPTIPRIDELQLDLLYDIYHARTATKGAVSLPVTTAVELDIPGDVTASIVAGGKLADVLLGSGSGKLDLHAGAHASLAITLVSQPMCVAGSRYCGGDKIAGDPDTLYECVAGAVPRAHAACPGACVIRTADDDECAAVGGTCTNGGLYCGGDKLAGDPSALYMCSNGSGTLQMQCANGCVVNAPPYKDACR